MFRFLRRLFRNDQPPPAQRDLRNLNEDWRAGDLAVAIYGGQWCPGDPLDPSPGDVLRVTEVRDGICAEYNVRAYFLYFEGKDQTLGWECVGFRKVHPEHVAAEDEFVTLIKRGRKVSA